MIEQLEESGGNVLGFRVSGDVGRADYDLLVPAVLDAVKAHGSVRLVLDMSDFRWEKAEAWSADLSFGRTFHDEIAKLAVVGRGTLGKVVTVLARPFYAREARHFEELGAAWEWARS